MKPNSRSFDLVVIGSGPGGYKAAITAAHLGARVALVEKGPPGGTCLNQGCIPKKTLMYLAGLIEDLNALNGRGLTGNTQGDFPAALHHKDQVVSDMRNSFPLWLRRLGVRLFHGQASLMGSNTIRITDPAGDAKPSVISAKRVVLATGARPRALTECPVDGRNIIDSRDFMLRQDFLPRSILCVGGGAIGVEFAYLLRQFGAEVTIVEQSNQLLESYCLPERAGRLLEKKFARLGVTVRTGTTVSTTELTGDGVHVKLTDGSEANYDQVLVAVGRAPNTSGLNLDKVGIELDDHGFVRTNEFLETSVKGIYAVGDVKTGPMTANAALHDGKVAGTNAILGPTMGRNYHRVPLVIDSALEIAAVGLSEDSADDAGFEPDAARANYSGSAKALGRNDAEGFVEVVHDEETGQMLGGCIVGPEAGEQIQMLTAACQSPRGLWFLKDINYSHPSWCEELENAVDPYTTEVLQSGKNVFRPGIYAINN
jgi:dihydrolipoamide dehydrogenase